MPVAAIIPIRSFVGGKDRLSSVLELNQRRDLSQALADHTVSESEAAGMLPVIVSADLEVAAWAMRLGLQVVEETGKGLNRAAGEGVRWATNSSLAWMVLHSDLPLVTAQELSRAMEIVATGRELLGPSSDGGTSALSAGSISEFSYGPGSSTKHLAAMVEPTILATTGLLHDLDSVNDLRSTLTHPRGAWVKNVIGDIRPD